MTHDPMLDGITRYGDPTHDYMLPAHGEGFVVLFSDLPALLAAAREEAAEAAMQIGRQIEKDNHAAGLCEPSYTHGREYQQQRLTNHDMHSGLACLTNYEQGQRDERERIRTGVTGLQLDNAGCVDYADLLAVIDAGSLPEGYRPTRTVTSPFAGGPL